MSKLEIANRCCGTYFFAFDAWNGTLILLFIEPLSLKGSIK
jgi:hypothetical protein